MSGPEGSAIDGESGSLTSEGGHARRARGFTLIELMIALALAGLIVGGALQLHVSFNRQAMRQNEVAEMQQTLRVSMLILERAVRLAGSGINGGKLVEAGDFGKCTGAVTSYYGFDWSDQNPYADPRLMRSTAITNDDDPDWFSIIYADSGPPVLSSNDNGANVVIDNPATADLSSFKPGDLFQIVFPPGVQCAVLGGSTTQPCSSQNCTREISAGGTPAGKMIQHNPAQSIRCFNPQAPKDDCIDDLGKYTATIRHISGGVTVYRVMTSNDPLNAGGTPKLTMRTAPIGTAEDDKSYPWFVIAENVEDMQLALVMKDGRICNSIDDTTICNPTEAAAVRITLVARSSSEIPGMTLGQKGQFEDESKPSGKDGYLRRALTAQVELRNMGANP